jgi:ribosomal protein L11 methyltransferase
MKWVEIAVEASESAVDAASNILIEEGCGGTVIGPTPADSSPVNRVAGYLPIDDRLEARLMHIRERVRLLPGYGLPLESDEVTVTPVADEEWATAWKKHFKPVRVGGIIVKPTWEECDAGPNDVIVEIDPGMAFGTGYHPTTQLCLLVLQEIVKGGEVVLDVGTGSGLLAIAAARLGAQSVVGLDIDSVAVEVAEENVRHAGLTDRVTIRRADSPLAFEGQADIVLANIIAKVLIDMGAALAEKVRPGGTVVASGIVTERADQVRRAFEAVGLSVVQERTDGEWVALVCERSA